MSEELVEIERFLTANITRLGANVRALSAAQGFSEKRPDF